MIKINRFEVIYEDNILSFSFSNKRGIFFSIAAPPS